MSTEDLLAVVGGVAAILAVWQAFLGAARSGRRHLARRSLRRTLLDFRRLDHELCQAVVEADHCLARGPGWTGWEIWPEELSPMLYRLRQLRFELDGMRARVRAQWAEGPIERLRDDIEQLTSSLRRAADLYLQGTIKSYREGEGKPLMWSASGRGPTRTLAGAEAVNEAEALRQTVKLLFRSGAYQLNLRDLAEQDDVALWPLQEHHSIALQEPSLSRETAPNPNRAPSPTPRTTPPA